MRARRAMIERAVSTTAAVVALVTATLVTAMVLDDPDQVEADADDIIAVVLDGTGNGHGRGMSQWGAYGWAVDQNKSWQWILDHYYGGTVSGTVDAARNIRVRLTGADNRSTVGVTSHGAGVQWNGLTRASMYATETAPDTWEVFGSDAIDCPSEASITVPSGDPPIGRSSVDVAGVRLVQRFLKAFHSSAVDIDGEFGPQTESILRAWQSDRGLIDDGVWKTGDAVEAQTQIDAVSGEAEWTSIGIVNGPVRFSTPGGDDPALTVGDVLGLCTDDASIVHHRGVLEVSSQAGGNRVVVDMAVEAYLRGVVPKEIAADWAAAGQGRGANAVRAQAVAARSYGLQQNRYSYAGTCDTQACQVYGGAATRAAPEGLVRSVEHPATDRAIAATAGVVRRWAGGHPKAGDIVVTEFSASNGPRTAGGAFPPVDDELGDRTAANPNHRWTRVLDADTLEDRYGLGQLTGVSMVDAAASQYRGFDGIWFNDLVLKGTSGSQRIQAWDLKRSLGLPSPGFTVRVITEDSTNRSLAVIGDSVTVGVGADGGGELPAVLDNTFTSLVVDAEVGRCTSRAACRGLSGVQAAELLPMDLDVVVVELGYNDASPGFADSIDQMMVALRARRVGSVLWVNMADIATTRSGGSRYASMNASLDAAASDAGDLTVLDWNAATAGFEQRARWFADDVHLSATGRSEYSVWLRSQLAVTAPSSRLVPPRRLNLSVVGSEADGVDGRPTVVPKTARAVALNIASVGPADAGFVTVWPCSMPRPTTSNLNYGPGQVVANNVLAPIDADGSVCLYSRASTDLIADLAGWVDGDLDGDGGDGGGGADFNPVAPLRLVDSRTDVGWSGVVSPDDPVVIEFSGRSVTRPDGTAVTIPDDVSAVNINLTGAQSTAPGYLTVWPCDEERPVASSLNYGAGETTANGVTAAVDGGGRLCVYAKSRTHVVVDLFGWFGGGDLLTATTPERVVDTRIGVGAAATALTPDTRLVVPVHGLALDTSRGPRSVPVTAAAVIVDVAAVDPAGAGFLTVWPCASARPVASNINYLRGRTVANGVVAPISPDGTICVYSKSATDVIVDVRGWFAEAGPGSTGFAATVPTRVVDTRIGLGPAPVL